MININIIANQIDKLKKELEQKPSNKVLVMRIRLLEIAIKKHNTINNIGNINMGEELIKTADKIFNGNGDELPF